MRSGRRSVLLLCDDASTHANTVLDHIGALRDLSQHRVITFNPRGIDDSTFLDFDDFDAVVVHYSLVLISDDYLSPRFRTRLRRYRGPKIQFIQDEYRWVDRQTTMMRELGIGVIFSCAPPQVAQRLYGTRVPGARIVPTLTGYMPRALLERATPPLRARPLDIAYRGRVLPYWLGSLAHDKAAIGRGVQERAPTYGLRCNIASSESSRIYGEAWVQFLSSTKATLGTESGASIVDFDGSVEREVHSYMGSHPHAGYADLYRDVLAVHDGKLVLKAISPRMFEAICLRTALILFPGEYSGILEPDRHYLRLEKDFSNFGDVVARLRDVEALQQMVDLAYADIADSHRYSYRALVRTFDEVVDEIAGPGRQQRPWSHRAARIEAPVRRVERRMRRLSTRLAKLALALGIIGQAAVLRKMLIQWAARPMGVPAPAVLSDLFKFGIMLWAHNGRLATRTPFDVTAQFDASSGSLMFVTEPRTRRSMARLAARPARWYEAARDSSIRSITWSHLPLGTSVPIRVAGREIEIDLGEERRGIHDFQALVRLGQRWPDRLGAMLAAIHSAAPTR